jgi:2-C-methyl-D-erythritol 4-phosphate cytidylyltransferase/2-C-methyl-D-erythritol 2,4-cyclodiphosphate synthase
MYVSAIIAAGGRGHRLGGAIPKQLLAIGGRPVLERSVSAFLAHRSVDEIIVALPADLAAAPPRYLRPGAKPLRLVVGGGRRQDSVANAFREVAEHADVVVIHDAARPFVNADLIDRTVAAAAESGAAIAAIQARDTVKRGQLVLRQAQDERKEQLVRPHAHGERKEPLILSLSKDEPAHWLVKETLARESIFLAQTPQAFRRHVLAAALALNVETTDEASLAELAGYRVRLVEGEASNIKITTREDVQLAEAIAATRDGRASTHGGLLRIGTGYDLHRLVDGRPLVVGGVPIPAERGALGHSDADVVCHAITDAVLGAASLGDIGLHFPDTDLRWKDASSLDLLARAAALVAAAGFTIANVDVTVVLERPKLRPHIDAMRQAIAGGLGADASCVSIKAKTNEGVDAVGRGEAIAAHAVVLLANRN